MMKFVLKDLKLFLSDKKGMFLTFLLPIILVSLFGIIFGVSKKREPRPQVLVVADEDRSATSKNILAQLDSLDELEIVYTSFDSAKAMVIKGEESAILIFHKGLADSVKKGVQPNMELCYDEAKSMELGMLQSALMAKLMDILGNTTFQQKALADFDKDNPSLDSHHRSQMHSQIIIQIEKEKLKNANLEKPYLKLSALVAEKENSPMLVQVVAGNSIMMLLFSVVGIGASLLEEKQEGTLKKLLISPIPANQILFGKMIYVNIISILQLSVLFIYAYLVFKLNVPEKIVPLILMIFVTAFACSSFGVLLASIAKTKSQVQGISTLIVLTMSAIGGSMIPTFVMPAFMQTMSHFTVNYWGIQGFYDIFWRNLPITDMNFLGKIAVLIGIGCVLNFIALSMFKRSVKKLV